MEQTTQVEDVRRWLDINLPRAMNVGNDNYATLLLLSTIDCFAQAWGNYPKNNNRDTFCSFVLKFSDLRDKLSAICPITLYYDYRDKYHFEEPRLMKSMIIPYDSPVLSVISNEYMSLIPEEEAETVRKKHQYIRLIYRLRSKLVHELRYPGTPVEFNAEKPAITMGREKGEDEKFWTLSFPKQFIFHLAEDTINNYLDQCSELPAKGIDLSWYE